MQLASQSDHGPQTCSLMTRSGSLRRRRAARYGPTSGCPRRRILRRPGSTTASRSSLRCSRISGRFDRCLKPRGHCGVCLVRRIEQWLHFFVKLVILAKRPTPVRNMVGKFLRGKHHCGNKRFRWRRRMIGRPCSTHACSVSPRICASFFSRSLHDSARRFNCCAAFIATALQLGHPSNEIE